MDAEQQATASRHGATKIKLRRPAEQAGGAAPMDVEGS